MYTEDATICLSSHVTEYSWIIEISLNTCLVIINDDKPYRTSWQRHMVQDLLKIAPVGTSACHIEKGRISENE